MVNTYRKFRGSIHDQPSKEDRVHVLTLYRLTDLEPKYERVPQKSTLVVPTGIVGVNLEEVVKVDFAELVKRFIQEGTAPLPKEVEPHLELYGGILRAGSVTSYVFREKHPTNAYSNLEIFEYHVLEKIGKRQKWWIGRYAFRHHLPVTKKVVFSHIRFTGERKLPPPITKN